MKKRVSVGSFSVQVESFSAETQWDEAFKVARITLQVVVLGDHDGDDGELWVWDRRAADALVESGYEVAS